MSVRVAAGLLIVAALVAGCFSPGPRVTGTELGGWILDCGIGAHEKAQDPAWLQACGGRASHAVGPKQEVWLAVTPTNPQNVVVAAKDNNPANSASCTWNGVYVTH